MNKTTNVYHRIWTSYPINTITDTDQIMEAIPKYPPKEAPPFQVIPLETTTSETHQPEDETNFVQSEHEPEPK